ncbi:hypothetical protein Shyhy01_17780 [Streptomyces hygroscopicus subsp. hygroscopicus]|nr:hypothetical protein Shyhy01_17780 [Streptomyces hygroscopicus subsp. hygroscopicus]
MKATASVCPEGNDEEPGRYFTRSAHCQYAAQPTPDRPDGAVIATTAPDRWAGESVRVLDLGP